MAKIGLKLPKYCLKEEGSAGKTMAKAIKADVKISLNDVKFYADDNIDESLKEFVTGTETIEVNDLSLDVYGELLGHTVTDGEVICNGDDVAPYVSHGFITSGIRNNAKYYIANYFPKVQFAEPDETSETKGETTSLKSSTIVGTIYRDDNGDWKKKKEFTSPAEAEAYLDGLLNITTETTGV